MKLPLQQFAFAAASLPFLYPSLSLADTPPGGSDSTLPISHLLDSAHQLIAQGDMYGALDKLDAAIKKDPQDYLTFFKRGTAYLSLGRLSQATADFDTVLTLRPGFESALLQRAKIKTKTGDWAAARKDYQAIGGKTHELAEIAAAEKASDEISKASRRKDWDDCIENAGVLLKLAPQFFEARQQRAKCRIARGDVLEGISDLQQLASLSPSLTDPHIHISSLYFYTLSEPVPAREQLRHCLTYDQDNPQCKSHLRQIRTLAKSLEKIHTLHSQSKYTSSLKLLPDLLSSARSEIKKLTSKGLLPSSSTRAPELITTLLTLTCEAYCHTKPPHPPSSHSICDELLTLSPHSPPAVLNKAHRLLAQDLHEQALLLLERAREHHPQDPRLQALSREAQLLLRRSKQKDYYKVLKVPRDASDRDIKKAYRKLAKEWHPDTYEGGLTKDEVEKKYAQITEAWEVLGNEDLRRRFDRGEDPNEQHQQGGAWQHGGGAGGFPFGGGFGGFPGGGFGGQQFQYRQGEDGGFKVYF